MPFSFVREVKTRTRSTEPEEVVLAHPYKTRLIADAQIKTDRLDAHALGDRDNDAHFSFSPTPMRSNLDSNPLDFIERDFICGPIVEFCGARAFMRRDCLGFFDGAAVQQIGRNPRSAESVAVGSRL